MLWGCSALCPATPPARGLGPAPELDSASRMDTYPNPTLPLVSPGSPGMWCLLRSGCLPMAGHKERLTLRGGDGKGQGKKGGRLKKGGKKAKYGGRKQKRRDNDSDESSLFVSEPISSSASDTRTSPIKKPSLLSLRGDDGAADDPQRGQKGSFGSLLQDEASTWGGAEKDGDELQEEETMNWGGYRAADNAKMVRLNPLRDDLDDLAGPGPEKVKRGGKKARPSTRRLFFASQAAAMPSPICSLVG